jgi:hypothetical protein
MPARPGLGLHDQQISRAWRQLRTLLASGSSSARSVGVQCTRYDAAPQDEELLAQQGVLSDELSLAARQVGQGVHSQTRERGVGGRCETMMDSLHETTTQA